MTTRILKHSPLAIRCSHKALLILFTVLCSLFAASLQAQSLDSLYTVWQDPVQPDSTRVNAYKDYIWNGYLFSRPDTAEVIAEALHVYANKHTYPKASGTGYNLQGIANAVQGNYPSALKYFQKGLAIEYEIGGKNGIAASLSNIGNIYTNQGNYPRALEYCQKALAIREEIGDIHGIAASLNNIGLIYQNQGNDTRALECYQKSLANNEKVGDPKGITGSLGNIGNIYAEQGNYPRALEHFQKGLAIEEDLGNKSGVAHFLSNIGNIYAEQGNYLRALEHFQKSLETNKEIGNKRGIGGDLHNIGILYKDQGEYKLALDYCQKGLDLALEIGVLDWQKATCDCLYDIYQSLGKDKEALKYFKQMIAVRDSLYNEENTKKMTRLEMQYDFDKKEAETKADQEKKDAIALQELKRQKLVRNSFMGGFAVVFLFAGVFFTQRNRIAKEKNRSEELLLNILPAEVAEELKAKGSADAVQIEQVTVLFTDFKGFTAMSELVSPKELVADLHECFSAFDSICEKYGIEKIKTIGDAYMAAGGLPSPNSTHPQDVARAALEMAEVVEKGKAKKIQEGLPFFEIRIGIHTGPVVAGIVGVKKFQYDIWGDTVNTASRMESSGAVGKVNISEATYALVKDQFTCEYRGEVEAKGKGRLGMYFVTEHTKS